MFRYAVRIRSFFQIRSICQASAASFSFRVSVRWSFVYAFLTNCCVIVEPPWTTPLCVMFAQTARAIPRRSSPRCSKNRLSSTATIACFITSAIWPEAMTFRFSGPRRIASVCPLLA